MPYLSWTEGESLRRHRLSGECLLGRDPATCSVAHPEDPSVSRIHARLHPSGRHWILVDQGSRNGIQVNGLPLESGEERMLRDRDRLQLGDWILTFTKGYPQLEGDAFIEGVGEVFHEVCLEDPQGRQLLHGLELLQRATEALLQEASLSGLIPRVLGQALQILGADRGFVVQMTAPGAWQVVHRIGEVQDTVGLSHSVLSYVAEHRMGLLSNAPLMDPRFGGASLVEMHRGALMCAPLVHQEELQGMVYVDRATEGRPFARFDLALFQSFVGMASVILRHAQLAERALAQAEAQGELMRLRTLHERLTLRTGEILGAMQSSLRWLKSYGEKAHGELAEVLRHQVERLHQLSETGIQEALLETPREGCLDCTLAHLQAHFSPLWEALVRVRGGSLSLEPPPDASSWLPAGLIGQALGGLVEPLLMGLGEGSSVRGTWRDEVQGWVLRLQFPIGTHGPAPDPWTHRILRETGLQWRWTEHALSLQFPAGVLRTPEAPVWPLLGLVSESPEVVGLMESVARAGELEVRNLEAEPPQGPLPPFKYLVVDAKGLDNPLAILESYRRHPTFGAVPILVVRAGEDLVPGLLAHGATDWLPEGFRWEMLHHRLQVLKGHDQLHRKALAAERLDNFRQMAGTLKHEINNPLAVISMQIELLERKYPDEAKFAKINEMIERIRGLMQVLQKMREAPVEEYPGGGNIVKLS